MRDPYGNPNSYYTDSPQNDVSIEAPGINSRKITASVVIQGGINEVWSILTDYNSLTKHVPNLVTSTVVPSPSDTIGTRLFQEGSQKIVGFDFRASLLMDMVEETEDEDTALKERVLRFTLVDSQMFASFDGSWTLKYHSRVRVLDPSKNEYRYDYKTKLTYTVFVRPKGPVPVIALEWRIREDIPPNLLGIKIAVEKMRRGLDYSSFKKVKDEAWGLDETLGSYM